jgi:hypothetical protein
MRVNPYAIELMRGNFMSTKYNKQYQYDKHKHNNTECILSDITKKSMCNLRVTGRFSMPMIGKSEMLIFLAGGLPGGGSNRPIRPGSHTGLSYEFYSVTL